MLNAWVCHSCHMKVGYVSPPFTAVGHFFHSKFLCKFEQDSQTLCGTRGRDWETWVFGLWITNHLTPCSLTTAIRMLEGAGTGAHGMFGIPGSLSGRLQWWRLRLLQKVSQQWQTQVPGRWATWAVQWKLSSRSSFVCFVL